MSFLKWSFKGQSFSAKYSDIKIKKEFREIFSEICRLYFFSANRFSQVTNISKNSQVLLENFFKHVKNPIELNFASTIEKPEKLYPETKLSLNKQVVMFTGGKDSLFQLMELIKYVPKDQILCLYLKNINKSETFYEQRSIKKICGDLGVKYNIVDCSNSIKLNRDNHNIGLREQLIFMACLPYILDFGARDVHFGFHTEGYEIPKDNLYTDARECWEKFQEILDFYGYPKFNIIPHPHKDDFETIEAIIQDEKILEQFKKTSSCYTQMNFRERQHKLLQSKFKTIELYSGCGNCVKCVRINAGFLKKAIDQKTISVREAFLLFTHIRKKFREKGAKDSTVAQYISAIAPHIEKYRLSRST